MTRTLLTSALVLVASAAASQDDGVLRRGIPAEALAAVAGCWAHGEHERWEITPQPGGRAIVRRVIGGPAGARMGRRARLESELMYQPAEERYAFAAAGRIHGLLLVFAVEGERLVVHPFGRRRGEPPRWTGSSYTLTRCAP